jgi:hypothetical protein
MLLTATGRCLHKLETTASHLSGTCKVFTAKSPPILLAGLVSFGLQDGCLMSVAAHRGMTQLNKEFSSSRELFSPDILPFFHESRWLDPRLPS